MSKGKKYFILLIGTGVLIFCIFLINKYKFSVTENPVSFIDQSYKQNPTILVAGKKVYVDVVVTDADKATGLSRRKGLADDAGMLFVWNSKSYPTFWMKNMLFPIDIIWISDSRIVGIQRSVPFPQKGTADALLTLYNPPEAVNFVLEVNAGFSDKNGVKAGDTVDLTNILSPTPSSSK